MRTCRGPVAGGNKPAAERGTAGVAAIPSGLRPRAVGWLLLVLLSLAATVTPSRQPSRAAEPFSFPALALERERLVIHAATDLAAIRPLLADFQVIRPDVAIEYLDLNTNELYASVAEAARHAAPDLVISSAMDLQVRLVNDGWTRPHVSHRTKRLPPWANWRDEAFGFTYEPAVIVCRRGELGGDRVLRSRPDLIRLLLAQPERFRGRVATYDPAESGVGYLLATQDSVLSSQFWRLASVLGDVRVRLYGTSAEMLDALERGEVAIAYNVLGSYARARAAAGAAIEVVEPRDYTLVLSRVVTIPARAASPALAEAFVDYLLSPRGQAVLADASGLPPILLRGTEGGAEAAPSADAAAGADRPIQLGPALLTFLDPMKRRRFLADWWLAVHVP